MGTYLVRIFPKPVHPFVAQNTMSFSYSHDTDKKLTESVNKFRSKLLFLKNTSQSVESKQPLNSSIESLSHVLMILISFYLTFCTDDVVPSKQVRLHTNNKTCVTKDLNICLSKKRLAFLSGDRRKVIRDRDRDRNQGWLKSTRRTTWRV